MADTEGPTWEDMACREANLVDKNEKLQFRIHKLEARVAELGTDPVTGLPTRRQSEEFAVAAWERAARSGRSVGVMLVDVDRFKLINDEAGHAQGDRILALVAEAIRGATRTADFVGRWGGDEFIIISETATPVSLARGAARILVDVEFSTPVTVSIGMAIEVDTDLNTLDVLARADDNLILVKAAGRNACR